MLLCLWAGKQYPYPFHVLEFPRPGDTQNTNGLGLLDLPVTAQYGPGYGHRVSPNGQSLVIKLGLLWGSVLCRPVLSKEVAAVCWNATSVLSVTQG